MAATTQDWELRLHNKSMTEIRQATIGEAQKMCDKIKDEGREFSDDEQRAFDSLVGAANNLLPHANVPVDLDSFRAYVQQPCTDHLQNQAVADLVSFGDSGKGAGEQLIDAATGQPIPVLGINDKLSSDAPSGPGKQKPPRVGELVRSILTGEGRGPQVAAGNITGGDEEGGYLTSGHTSRQILDLARSASVVQRNGAGTVVMSANELNMVRLTKDPEVNWRREWEGIKSSDTTFDRITLRPKTVAAIVPMSVELAEDAANAASMIERALAAALGLALDQAALFGVGGASEPQGIVNTDGINTITAVGIPTNYTAPTSAIQSILAANYPGDVSRLAWLRNPRDGATYDGLTDSIGQPLQPTPWASRLRPDYTTSFATDGGAANDESQMIIGDFSQVIFGMRSGVRFETFRSGMVNHSDGAVVNAFSQLGILLRAYMRVDVAVMRPSWMTVLNGVKPPST
ncbi:MAG: phage major capsid protein [Planctomycetota bacterium]